MKRNVNICAGDKPLSNNILVNTKVLPQMATVIKAMEWPKNLLLIVCLENLLSKHRQVDAPVAPDVSAVGLDVLILVALAVPVVA